MHLKLRPLGRVTAKKAIENNHIKLLVPSAGRAELPFFVELREQGIEIFVDQRLQPPEMIRLIEEVDGLKGAHDPDFQGSLLIVGSFFQEVGPDIKIPQPHRLAHAKDADKIIAVRDLMAVFFCSGAKEVMFLDFTLNLIPITVGKAIK